ncbi:hypothetical protein HMPREF9163_01296 [Selenomonas sp. oral taxon 138 str. F0429]|nr:hypothetical protein HMPREF9163_01296 [Selenomonas sp. oral taxon 138 str. F0429]
MQQSFLLENRSGGICMKFSEALLILGRKISHFAAADTCAQAQAILPLLIPL